MHASYERLVELAERSYQAGRCPHAIAPGDIDLARLYSHAFRAHVIGAFDGTRRAVEAAGLDSRSSRSQAAVCQLLAELADLSMDPIVPDARALLSTFRRYDTGICRVLDALEELTASDRGGTMERVGRRFREIMEGISTSAGLPLTRDTEAPVQASFTVPNLGITIVPLVYGDYHSWNLAYLRGPRSDVPCHLHREGVEIHLGYAPMHGDTILGPSRAEVAEEGYAMPIPPGTVHGYVNDSEHEHHVPFIYGSLKAGGWGVFLDVEPQSVAVDKLRKARLDSRAMNGSIYLERALDKAEALSKARRQVLIPVKATDRNGCGGLELAVARVTSAGLRLPLDSFRIVSVVRGEGRVAVAGIEQLLKPHDHFGIPAGMSATMWQKGRQGLVVLDAVMRVGKGQPKTADR